MPTKPLSYSTRKAFESLRAEYIRQYERHLVELLESEDLNRSLWLIGMLSGIQAMVAEVDKRLGHIKE